MKKKNLAVLLLVLAVLSAGIGIYKFYQEKNAGKEYEEIKQEVVKPTPTVTPMLEKEPEVTKVPLEVPIDFETLQEQNAEVYAWIQIPGTDIDYPILQSGTDNAYYLSHTINHEEKTEGAIFTEDYNAKDFTDPNTVIYGHDMKNGSMFQNLHRFMDRAFFDQYRDVTIYQPEQILHYKIFAAYLYDNRHLLQSIDFEDKDVFRQYLNNVFSMRDMQSFVDTSIEVTAEDKIITLSTCYAGISTQRYLVQAVLVSIEN